MLQSAGSWYARSDTNPGGGFTVRRLFLLALLAAVAGCSTVYHARVGAGNSDSPQASANLVDGCLRKAGFEPRKLVGWEGPPPPDEILPRTWFSRDLVATVDVDGGDWALRFVPPPSGGKAAGPAAAAFERCIKAEAPQQSIQVIEGPSELDWR